MTANTPSSYGDPSSTWADTGRLATESRIGGSPAGQHLYTFGHQGEGPEFENIEAMRLGYDELGVERVVVLSLDRS